MKNLLLKLSKLINASDIYLITYLPPVLGLSLILLGAYIGDKIYNDGLPLKYTSLLFAISMFISSFSGVVQIVRRESPWLFKTPFRGPIPVFLGSIWVVFCWIIAGLALYYMLTG